MDDRETPHKEAAEDAQKATLLAYLRQQRRHLLSKLEGLDEYDARRPMTPTGTNLLGIVKHVASVELGYFTEVFGRPQGRDLPWFADGAEPDADFWAAPDETRESVLELHAYSAERSDATIEELPLDAPGEVPWWPEERRRVTLQQILVHMCVETARHTGQADILRELIDGAAGLDTKGSNLPDRTAEQWAEHRASIETAARKAAGHPG